MTGPRVTVRSTQKGPEQVLAHLTRTGIRFDQLRITGPTLDDAYLALTAEELDS